MISANDLRVGNWVLYESSMGKNKLRITEISEKDICKDLFPIPLTEEILVKCGFKKYQWQNAFFIKTDFGHLYIHFYNGRIITRMVKVSKDSLGHKMIGLPFLGTKKSIENILHLHTLQNVFYYLSGGKELEVSL